jgi:hypothetical protein
VVCVGEVGDFKMKTWMWITLGLGFILLTQKKSVAPIVPTWKKLEELKNTVARAFSHGGVYIDPVSSVDARIVDGEVFVTVSGLGGHAGTIIKKFQTVDQALEFFESYTYTPGDYW